MLKKLIESTTHFFESNKNLELDIPAVEKVLNYRFKNKSLLNQAFKHRSYLTVNKEDDWNSNERLEFLGDAVLELVVTEFLYTIHPQTAEGELSKQKSVLVSRKLLAELVRDKDLGKFLLVNRGEEKTGGRKRTSNLANLFESLVGAIYLDGGLKPAQKFIEALLLARYEVLVNEEQYINYKSILLEYAQGLGMRGPVYQLLSESGPDHEKIFTIEARLREDAARAAGYLGGPGQPRADA